MVGTTWHYQSRMVWILWKCMNVSGFSYYRLNGGNHMALSEEDVDPMDLTTCMKISGSSCFRLNGGNHMALSEQKGVDPLYLTTCMKVSGTVLDLMVGPHGTVWAGRGGFSVPVWRFQVLAVLNLMVGPHGTVWAGRGGFSVSVWRFLLGSALLDLPDGNWSGHHETATE